MDEFRQLSIREFVISNLSQEDRGLGMDQTKQTEAWVWARRNRPTIGYGPEQTDPRLGMGQTKQTEDSKWTRRNRPMFGYWPDRTDRRLCMDQSKQTNVWVLTRTNISSSSVGQTEQTQFRYGQDGAARPKICPDYELGRTGPPCPRPRSVWPILVLGRGLHPGF